MNPALLLLVIPLLSAMKKGVKNTLDGKYNNVLLLLILGVVIYIVVKGFNKSKQQTYLDTIGTDVASQQAVALRDAMNQSGIEIAMATDGTDEDLIFATAAKITDYKAVSDSYRVIFSSELTTDLSKELSRTDFQKFLSIVNANSSTKIPNSSNTSAGTTSSLIGKKVVATVSVNVRQYDDYNKIAIQAKAGETIGTYLGEQSLFINGQSGVFYIVESAGLFGLFSQKYYVLKASTKLV